MAVGAAVLITGGIALANPAPKSSSAQPAGDTTSPPTVATKPRIESREYGRPLPYGRDFDDDGRFRAAPFGQPNTQVQPNTQAPPSVPVQPNTRSRGS